MVIYLDFVSFFCATNLALRTVLVLQVYPKLARRTSRVLAVIVNSTVVLLVDNWKRPRRTLRVQLSQYIITHIVSLLL